jgi:D-alanyl-D-alanine carboxypeptidase
MGTLVTTAGTYALVREISVQQQIQIESHFKTRIQVTSLPNTNQPLLFDFDNIRVSKTGFTNPAGWCVAMVVNKHNQEFAVVILGEKNKQQRESAVKRIIQQLS